MRNRREQNLKEGTTHSETLSATIESEVSATGRSRLQTLIKEQKIKENSAPNDPRQELSLYLS